MEKLRSIVFSSRTDILRCCFVVSAGSILLVTGIAKVVSAFGTSRILDLSDPIFSISFRHLFASVGLLETIVAVLCVCRPKELLSLGLTAWVAISFLLYRSGLVWVGWHRPCPCLGNLSDTLHVNPDLADSVSKVLIGYLVCGSGIFWGLASFVRKKTSFRRAELIDGDCKNVRNQNSCTQTRYLTHFTMLWLMLTCSTYGSFAEGISAGSWLLSGEIADVQGGVGGSETKNRLSLKGHYAGGKFLIDLVPISTQDNIAESVGWDGGFLRLIQRFPSTPGGRFRDSSVGFVEPSVFSRYASDALTSVLLAFAGSNSIEQLTEGNDFVVLGVDRLYPEEDNTYEIKHVGKLGIEMAALCPAEKVTRAGRTPIAGFENRFLRWSFRSTFIDWTATNSGLLEVEYKRFKPLEGSKGRLLCVRHVSGKIIFQKDPFQIAAFHPNISEDDLRVLDYSYRHELFPLSKGISDQCYPYVLTNHAWDFDTNIVAASFLERRAVLAGHVPAELRDVVQPVIAEPLRKGRRSIIVVGLIAISVVFLWILFRSQKNHRQ